MKGLLTSILTVLTFTGLQAQPLPSTPKLVVGLTIDQLRTDYLEAFSTLYGDRGFRRLWKEGRVFRNAEYTFSGTDRASAIAAIYTGTTPSVNGIIGKRWMDVSTLRTVSCVDDPAFMGNYTNESSSPSHLLTSTIADELKIATRNEGLVYAIAPFRDAAILAAGHAGNGAFWLNNTTGKWCGTTYYSEFPWWVSQYNDRNAIDFRIADMTWTPVHPVQSYSFLPEWRDAAFKYKFDDDRVNKYKRLITSPFINDEINTLTEELLDKSTMGKDHVPDMLALTYYAGNYAHKSVQECAMEMQDTYVRLDRSIASLLDIIDKKVGLQNVVFFITSTGYTDTESPDLGLYRVPTGEFHLNRCAALLNMYLMATYGQLFFQRFFQCRMQLPTDSRMLVAFIYIDGRLNCPRIRFSSMKLSGIRIPKHLSILLGNKIWILCFRLPDPIGKFLQRRYFIFKCDCSMFHIWCIDGKQPGCICLFRFVYFNHCFSSL